MLVEMESGKSFSKGQFVTSPLTKKKLVYKLLLTMYKIDGSTDIGMTFM